MDEKRTMVALFGVAVAVVTAYVAYRFIAALTVAVFLYYSTRRFYKSLERLRLPATVRAMLVISFLVVPFLALASYTVALLVVEVRNFVAEYPVAEMLPEDVGWVETLENPPELTIQGLAGAYQAGTFDPFLDFALANADVLTGLVSSFLLNALIVVVVTYYLLIDGSTVHEWLLRFDDDAIVREYLEAADEELEAVLFGNLLNVILISLIAIITFMGYNAAVPSAVEVPYPALAGALTGVASLIPVVGMKIVYVPLVAAASLPLVLEGQYSALVYLVGFLVLAIVVVDTIPDLVLRPYLSGKRTHVGLLMLAYIFGPIVFGFYGLFLAPIILVLGLTFADTALPRLLGADAGARDYSASEGAERLTTNAVAHSAGSGLEQHPPGEQSPDGTERSPTSDRTRPPADDDPLADGGSTSKRE
ncbi:AI-2E family transporter [Natrarchaeobius oligotrophus]|uniref:AI-2E family transporter n=1 Tax=Natrarchaeobius chitinivorans TaxID=1679083 RepID=A0A3N6MBN7_NATCH|nr:AI-2E family transporter [Natrarchaeobius chitinivorans]RQH01209.1 AI-2E family transporter [Natrarchaeobius chitinivorans]